NYNYTSTINYPQNNLNPNNPINYKIVNAEEYLRKTGNKLKGGGGLSNNNYNINMSNNKNVLSVSPNPLILYSNNNINKEQYPIPHHYNHNYSNNLKDNFINTHDNAVNAVNSQYCHRNQNQNIPINIQNNNNYCNNHIIEEDDRIVPRKLRFSDATCNKFNV